MTNRPRRCGRPRKYPAAPIFTHGFTNQENKQSFYSLAIDRPRRSAAKSHTIVTDEDNNEEPRETGEDLPDVHEETQANRRGRRSLLHGLDDNVKMEMVQYRLKHGTNKTASVFTEKLGRKINNHAIRRLMKTYLDSNEVGNNREDRREKYEDSVGRLTPVQQKQIAKHAIRYSVAETADYFSRILGRSSRTTPFCG